MSLQQELDAFREASARKAPPGRVELFEVKIRELEAELASRQMLRPGSMAPDFTLPDAVGNEVSLRATLARGPAVVTFYRGGWCPYCNLQLAAYQRMLPEIERLGARLIAISPQTPDSTLTTTQKNALTFDVLSDVGSQVAQDYGICFELPVELQEAYTASGNLLPQINGVERWELPVPATFVVDVDGRIAVCAVDADYRRRLEPEAVIAALRGLRTDA